MKKMHVFARDMRYRRRDSRVFLIFRNLRMHDEKTNSNIF